MILQNPSSWFSSLIYLIIIDAYYATSVALSLDRITTLQDNSGILKNFTILIVMRSYDCTQEQAHESII